MISTVICARAQMGGPAPAPGTMIDPAASLNFMLTNEENLLMGIAKAMPAEKYGFAPSQAIFVPAQKTEYTGVRTFGGLVIHVAQANYRYGTLFGVGMKPEIDPMTLTGLKDKDAIVAALAASFAFLHKAVATITTANAFEAVRGQSTRATVSAGVVVHCADEYGQMVEYLRMNGIVPPASVH